MNTTRSEAQWPHDERSDQVHAEQIRDRERVQQDIQEAWDRVMGDLEEAWDRAMDDLEQKYDRECASESDIKLLKWALGVK